MAFVFHGHPMCSQHVRSAIHATPFMSVITYSGSVQYIEHVIVKLTLVVEDKKQKGDITVNLTSPSGTLSTLLGPRRRWIFLYRSEKYVDWPFMSAMFWGEDPTGDWTLTVGSVNINTTVNVSDVEFQFYGVSEVPEAVANIPAQCHSDCRRGCAREGSNYCDSCVYLRNAYTLECIDHCPPGYTEHNGYCYDSSLPTKECDSSLKVKEGG